MKKSIETNIRLNAIFIYLLIALVCGGVFIYFYTNWKNIDSKKKTIEEYNEQLVQISELIYSVNQAQAEVNLFIITEKRNHLNEFQEQAKNINLRIDSLKNSQYDFGIDTILTEITELLKRKEKSIILLNKQFSFTNPIDSLSRELTDFSSSLQKEQPDSLQTIIIESSKPAKKGFWRRLGSVFSPNKEIKADTTIISVPVDTTPTVPIDTLQVSRIIRQARVNYKQQMAAIENQINSVVLADQNITSRITELLIQLYNKIIQTRMEELDEDEELLRKNNIHALIVGGGIALFLILVFIILILHYVNKGYSARKALEQENDRTRQLMESRHKLLLTVSHDVKTPLNSMLGYIELYRKQGILTTKEITPLNSSGSHILALLNNLLEFSSLEKGSITLVNRNFSPFELCSELCAMFIPLTNKKSLTFVYHIDFVTNLTLYSDCLRIRQILTNIISNAIKYTIEGSISFNASYKNKTLEFRISDTGVGIPADKQQDLFKPFTRIEENNVLDEGNGFGLYVVKGLIELFKGDMQFQSEPGKGTTITISLPVQESKLVEINQSARQILLIDDDSVYLDMLSGLCQQLGHQVKICINRSEFNKEVLNLHTYDCILTDMEMGSFTGKEVLKRTREINKEIPVILITGRQDFNQSLLLSDGFTDYLLKPITLNGLHSLIGGKIGKEQINNASGLFGQGEKEIRPLMEDFIMVTVNHLILLKETMNEDNFEKAQYLCHKMLPMFLQLDAPSDITQILKHMDSLRGVEKPDEKTWEQIQLLIDRIEKYLTNLEETYLTDSASYPV